MGRLVRALLIASALLASAPAHAELVLSFELGETRWSGVDRTLDFRIVGEASDNPENAWAIRIEPEGGSGKYRIAITGDLPDGVSYDSIEGVLRGSLVEPGASTVTVAVIDASGDMVTTELSIVVTEESDPLPSA